jgi:hypothetical protein
LVVAAALYLAFPARVLECDAVIYASAALHVDVEISTDPGHLGFGLIELAAAAVGRRLTPPLSPVYILPYLSIAAAIAGLYGLFRTLLDAGVKHGRAICYAGVVGFSYGYWHFALQAESHILSASYAALAVLPYIAVGLWVRDIRSVEGFREWILGMSTWGAGASGA